VLRQAFSVGLDLLRDMYLCLGESIIEFGGDTADFINNDCLVFDVTRVSSLALALDSNSARYRLVPVPLKSTGSIHFSKFVDP